MRRLAGATVLAAAAVCTFASPASAAPAMVTLTTGEANLGHADVGGTYRCDPSAPGTSFLSVRLRQGASFGAVNVPVACDGTVQSWAASVPGVFNPGAAGYTVYLFTQTQSAFTTGTVVLA
jgi:hypothetical protein